MSKSIRKDPNRLSEHGEDVGASAENEKRPSRNTLLGSAPRQRTVMPPDVARKPPLPKRALPGNDWRDRQSFHPPTY